MQNHTISWFVPNKNPSDGYALSKATVLFQITGQPFTTVTINHSVQNTCYYCFQRQKIYD